MGVTRLRRLTRAQLDNTIRDLLGVEAGAERTLGPDERIGPFDSNAIAPVTDLLVQQSQELAARVAIEAVARMEDASPCDLRADPIGCPARFVDDFGRRAFRRPLAAEEVDAFVGLYELGAASGGPEHGFRLVVEAMLQAPSFLYHADTGLSDEPSATPQPATGYELASRLSYFLWNSMPDDELFALADRGALADPAVLSAQVERMLDHPRALPTMLTFHRQWLGLRGLEDASKDPVVHPEFDAAMAQEMLAEVDRFVAHTLVEGDGTLATLLSAAWAFPEDRLFGVYGIEPPVDFVPGMPVAVDPDQRAGLLTTPAFLARHAHGNQSSPVHRGIVIRENVLCQRIQPPPPNANTTPPPPSEVTTTRERFAQHVADPACASCHALIDPPGLAFEHYDAIGAYRVRDGAGPVDASGELKGVEEDLTGSFRDAIELTQRLAHAAQVEDCVASQWFRFALGRVESNDDACSIEGIRSGFRDSGGDLRALMTEVALSDAFRFVRATAEEDEGR